MPPPKKERPRHSYLYARTRNVATMIFPVAGQPATRLVSAPSPSPLACVAVWASGKDKRHKIVKAGQLVGEHRYSMLPRFKDGRQSTDVNRENKVTVGSRCSGLLGPCWWVLVRTATEDGLLNLWQGIPVVACERGLRQVCGAVVRCFCCRHCQDLLLYILCCT